jgi:SPW repeat
VSSPTTPIEEHPDLVALRMRYDRAVETPVARGLNGLSFLVGLFVAASAWIVGFSGLTTLAVNNLIIGIAMCVFAIGFASAYGRTHGIAWVAPLLGAWTIIAPWSVAGDVYNLRTILTNVIAGGLFLLLSAAAIGLGLRRPGAVGRAREH